MSFPPPPKIRRPFPLRVLGFFAFVYVFFRELTLANIHMAAVVLTHKREDLKPGFLVYPIEGLTKLEIFVLGHFITLTPGTSIVEFAPDFSHLLLHSLDSEKGKEIIEHIERDFQSSILWWTR